LLIGILCWIKTGPVRPSWRFKIGAILLARLTLYNEQPDKLIAYYPGEQSLAQAEAAGYSILVDCRNEVGQLAPGVTP
jgi:hypothetical protein